MHSELSANIECIKFRTQLWAHQENPDPKCVSFLSTSSHDDVIDTLNAGEQAALLALYIFAKPLEAKYLAQFIRTQVSFVNRIPTHVLSELILEMPHDLILRLMVSQLGPLHPGVIDSIRHRLIAVRCSSVQALNLSMPAGPT